MSSSISGTSGSTLAGNSNAVGNFSVGGALAVTGAATVGGNATITGSLTVGGVQINAGPTFSAYRTAARNTAAGTWTTVIPDTEEFDTAGCYDSTTGRFTPTVAGYYQINGQAYATGVTGELMVGIWKNGGGYKYGNRGPSGNNGSTVSSIIYMNGTTDYLELYVYYSGSPAVALTVGGTTYNYLNGAFIRPA